MRGCGLGRGRSTRRRRNNIAPRRRAGPHFCLEAMLGPRRGKEYRHRQDGRVVGHHHTSKEKTPALTSGRVGPAMGLCDAGPPTTRRPAIASLPRAEGDRQTITTIRTRTVRDAVENDLTSLPTASAYTTKMSCAGCRTSPKIAPRLVRIWLAVPKSQEG